MPRIRTLKPEFWSDEKLGPLDPLTRLVFLGLISHADDAGRLVDSVRQLDGLLFPYSEDTCAEALETLARLSRVSRYASESGQRLIQIEGWAKHQRVDKPSKYTLPPPPALTVEPQGVTGSSRDPRESLAESSRPDLRPWSNDLLPTTSDLRANAHARNGLEEEFNHLYAIGHSGPLMTAEGAYYETREAHPGLDPDTIARRWRSYIARQKAAGLNVPHLANWLRRGGWADESLDITDEAVDPEELPDSYKRIMEMGR